MNRTWSGSARIWSARNDGGPVSETNTFTTAAIGKDIWPDGWPRASVTYGPNNTATVTFFAGFSVGLTNVCGSGSAL